MYVYISKKCHLAVSYLLNLLACSLNALSRLISLDTRFRRKERRSIISKDGRRRGKKLQLRINALMSSNYVWVCFRARNSSLSREPVLGTAYSRENAIFRLAWHRVLSTRLYYFVKTKPTEHHVHEVKKGTTIILLEALANQRKRRFLGRCKQA